MQREFDDLYLIICGSRCGNFRGIAQWDDDGILDRVTVYADIGADGDVLLRRNDKDGWYKKFNEALARYYRDDLDEWRATKKDRALLNAAERRDRQRREEVA